MAANVRALQTHKAAAHVVTKPDRPDRQGKRLISGHFQSDTYFALHELLAQIGRQTGVRLTVQDAVAAAFRLFFQKYGSEIPAELKQAIRPPCRISGKSRATTPVAE